MKIGIPSAGYYYFFYPFIDVFFKEIGLDVIYSPKTNKEILEKGISLAHSDICFPMKVLFGHIFWLKDKVDLVFVPRCISFSKNGYLCPKFIGLPDMLQTVIPDFKNILVVDFNVRKEPIMKTWYKLGKKLCSISSRVESAIKSANEVKYSWNNSSCDGLKIGIVSRPYILYDEYVSCGVLKILNDKNISLLTSDNVDEDIIQKELRLASNKPIYWDYGVNTVGAAYYFLNSGNVNGLIHLVSFDCGPDSVLKELIVYRASKTSIPTISLVVDEHTGMAGIVTRIEAFLDLIK